MASTFRDIGAPEASAQDEPSGRSVIAVIGIDQHAAWPRLHNAVSDASGALDLFMRLGFSQVTAPLFDRTATGDAMQRLVRDDLAKLSTDDRLVLFFAGHGYTTTTEWSDVAVKTGYIIPSDAQAVGGQVATWIRLDSWLSDIARLPPRHILVIVDACRSGIALGALVKWRDADPQPTDSLEHLRARRSRRIITSALDDQLAMDGGPVPGHSLFTGCLIEGLRGGLARDGRRVTTGSELGLYLQQRVSSYPASTQTPDFGALELDDRGELVLPILIGPTEGPVRPWQRPTVLIAAPAQEPVLPPPWPPQLPDPRPARRWLVLGAIGLAAVSAVAIGTIVGAAVGRDKPAAPRDAGVRDTNPPVDAPVDAGPVDAESPSDRLQRENPFETRGSLSVQTHLVTRGEYARFTAASGAHAPAVESAPDAPIQLRAYTEAIALCAELHARLPTEDECKVVRSAHPGAWVWGAKNEQAGLVFICNNAESPLYVDPRANPKNIGLLCVK